MLQRSIGEHQEGQTQKEYKFTSDGKPKSELTDRINEAVVTGRKNEEWRSQYMKEQIIIEEAIEEERKRTEAEKQRADNAERDRDILIQQLIDAGITPADVPQ